MMLNSVEVLRKTNTAWLDWGLYFSEKIIYLSLQYDGNDLTHNIIMSIVFINISLKFILNGSIGNTG